MSDYMLTVLTTLGARDVQVNGASGIREAIALAEKATGAPVDHGRGGILSEWYPAIIIDATTGEIQRIHERPAEISMQIVNHAQERGVTVPRGS